MPMYDYLYLIESDHAVTTDDYSSDQIDFGYDNPNPGRGGKFGMHVVVTETFVNLNQGIILWIVTASTASPTESTDKHIGRFVPVAKMIVNAHFFIPGGHSLARYARGWWDVVSTAADGGKLTAWFGPDEDGAI